MGSSVIFSGTKVKTLKSTIDLNGGNDIISSATDPTSSAVSANIGSLLLNTSSGKLYRKNDSGSSTNWTEVGASGQAGINYISNPNASTNTTGWSTYADAAGSAPVDGTGGVANVTWTRQTSSPLRGAADFRFTKDAVNRQGQGVSIDFTIDNADIAKPLTVTFDYELVSGTYATGDLTVYLIADPAGTPVVIQPAGYQIQSATASTKMRNIATFQTQASGTSYRLCFHVASTSASAYTIDIDSVVVGPQVVQYGAPVTDWVSFTPTGAHTANVTWTGRWRRVGDNAEFHVRSAYSGATTAADWTVNIPFGWTIDTNKLAGTNIFSFGNGDCLVGGNHYFGNVIYNSTTNIKMGVIPAANTNTHNFIFVTNTVPGTFGAGEYVDARFIVPITGWSSTVVMSNDTDTRVVAARVYKNGNQGPFSVETKLTSYTVDRDTHGMWDSTNNRFNIPVPGDYQLFIQNNGVPSTTATQVIAYRVNAGSSVYIGTDSLTSAQARFGGTAIIPNLKAGDYVEIYHFTSANTTIQAGTTNTFASLSRISGPSAIAASETVAMLYKTSAGASANNNTNTAITFGTKVYDTHSSYSGSTFTVPVSGKYLCSMALYTAATTATATDVQLNIYKNGSVYQGVNFPKSGTANTPAGGCASVLVNAVAGDTIQGYWLQNTGGALALLANDSYNYLHIVRVGN